jgi:anti-sigma factor RsiW
MSSHPGREDLLGFHLGLLAHAERSGIEAHLEGCSECRAALDEVGEMMDVVDQKIPVDGAEEIEPLPLVQRLSRSVVTPALVMGVSIVLSAMTDVAWMLGSVVPLLAGAGVVVWWLHGVVS